MEKQRRGWTTGVLTVALTAGVVLMALSAAGDPGAWFTDDADGQCPKDSGKNGQVVYLTPAGADPDANGNGIICQYGQVHIQKPPNPHKIPPF